MIYWSKVKESKIFCKALNHKNLDPTNQHKFYFQYVIVLEYLHT